MSIYKPVSGDDLSKFSGSIYLSRDSEGHFTLKSSDGQSATFQVPESELLDLARQLGFNDHYDDLPEMVEDTSGVIGGILTTWQSD